MLRAAVGSLLFMLAATTALRAEVYELQFGPATTGQFMDRWMYPFNVTPGVRIQSPTFGAVGSEGFDERDGQYVIGINTAALGIPTGAPPLSYRIESARLFVTEAVGGYTFDPSYDGYRTYLDASMSAAEVDADGGRPIELYAAGFRNGFEQFGWPDGGQHSDAPIFSAGTPFGESGRATRNVFASDVVGNDVSNNIDSLAGGADGFDTQPLAIGQAVDSNEIPLAAGDLVDGGTSIYFDIDVRDSAINGYLQQGLAQGQIGFVVASLHATGEQGIGDPFVNLVTANHFALAGPKFEINVVLQDETLAGDYNQDGILGLSDIDVLVQGIVSMSDDLALDLNDDGIVGRTDLHAWVNELFGTYVGDANLDGEFNSADFVHVLGAGQYEDTIVGNSTWTTGDWNTDSEFDSNDFVAALGNGGYELGPPSTIAVPEPSLGWCLATLAATAFALRRKVHYAPINFRNDDEAKWLPPT